MCRQAQFHHPITKHNERARVAPLDLRALESRTGGAFSRARLLALCAVQRAIQVHIKELWDLGAALARRVARVVRRVGQHVLNGRARSAEYQESMVIAARRAGCSLRTTS